jgi:hypothetical protein
VLASHPIAILAPRRFAPLLGDWLAARLDLAALQLHLHLVDDHWLADVPAYNHLMLQPWFYEHYQGFSHLLIAQLDSYVFGDHLLHWCGQPYAYLGAPIYPEGAAYGEAGCQAVGCGEFSLRTLAAFRQAFACNPRLVGLADLLRVIRGYNLRGAAVRLLRLLRLLLSGDCRLRQRHNLVQRRLGQNEDVIFAEVLPRVLPGSRFPTTPRPAASALIATWSAIWPPKRACPLEPTAGSWTPPRWLPGAPTSTRCKPEPPPEFSPSPAQPSCRSVRAAFGAFATSPRWWAVAMPCGC